MDVRHYFDPIDFSKYSNTGSGNWKYTIGYQIEKTTAKLSVTNLQRLEAVIIGIPFENGECSNEAYYSTNTTREELYHLAALSKKINIADLGNLKITNTQKAVFLALRDVIEYFNEINVVTIVIGGSQELTIGICDAFQNQSDFTLSCVDAYLDVRKGRDLLDQSSYLSKIFQSHPGIFQFSLLGYQGHLVPAELFSRTRGLGVHLRLGNLREDFSQVEPVLRNSHVLSFDMCSIKSSEAPGIKTLNPNGLRSEEACQLARYAGISDNLKVFGLFGVNTGNEQNPLTTKLSAQIIWYFLDGFINRIDEIQSKSKNLVKYKVEVNEVDKPMVFYNSKESFRWWMEVTSVREKKALIACSEKEYRQASNNEIPELWLRYVQKIDETSK